MAVALGAGLAIVEIGGANSPDTCDTDLVCLPDLGPLILAVFVMPFVLAIAGPAVAWALRLPTPLLFAAPAAVAFVATMGLLFGGLGPLAGWALGLLVLVSYVAAGIWVTTRPSQSAPGDKMSSF